MEKNTRTMGHYIMLKLFICLFVVMNTHHVYGDKKRINLTYITNAVEKQAVCNDGSPAAYYYDPGFGEGVNNWIIFLRGGSWCNSTEYCGYRLRTPLGSSKYINPTATFEQIRSANRTTNPDFYNWHRILVMYCDGSSFMGNACHPRITSRGARIFDVLIEEMLEKGMANANNAILAGDSAGGLAALLHCDEFRALLHRTGRVKCLIDSGFFAHAPKLHGAQRRAEYFAGVAAYHGFTNKLPSSCTSRMNASLCIFPENFIKNIQTPLFLLEAKFDIFQMAYVSDEPNYLNCIMNLTLCTHSHFQTMRDYGVAVTELLQEIRDSSSIGMFVHPCLRHGHFQEKSGWGWSYKLRNKTIAEAIGDWYYDRSGPFQEIDSDHEFPLSLNCTKIPNI
ncbi:hypothetical protein CASFOL_021078 [Castilleja foliolosa]|uniref:Pectin acetylesterase n=1 Tax=Castilleja foliolosa TaxID=1961234 RepID=A0ABD3CY63_9LAMI